MPLTEAIDKATSPHQPPHAVPSFPQDANMPLTPSLNRSFKLTLLYILFVCP